MSTKASPEAADGVPRLQLVLPPLVPLVLLSALPAAQLFGHELSAHGDGLILAVLFQVSAVVALLYELWVLPKALVRLRVGTGTRQPLNWLCFGFAATFSAVYSTWLAYAILLAR